MLCLELPLQLFKYYFVFALHLSLIPTVLAILPQGAGRDLVIENCTACHSEKIIVQNHLSRANWDHIITKMQTKHNLWELDKKTRSKILDYLSTQLSPQQKHLDSQEYFEKGMTSRKTNPLPIGE